MGSNYYKRFVRINIFVLFLSFILFTLDSCVVSDVEDTTIPQNNEPRISLRFNVAGTRGDATNEIEEKIRSIRIIMLSDGFIEYNAKVDFTDGSVSSGGSQPATSFTYLLERPTVAGNKKFYIIANEESVKKIKFDDIQAADLPEGIYDEMSLSDFLNYFTKDKLPADGTYGYSNSGSGKNFEALLNSSYFMPDYTITDNTVYLLYTSYYDGIAATDDQSFTIEKTMYIVPVATKFTFNLKNFRREKVRLHEVTLSNINSGSYLMAALDESEIEKTLDGRSYYWIDWFQKVSEGSHSASDLGAYNNKVGWIENYSMPEDPESDDDYLSPELITSLDNESWVADQLTNKDNPSAITFVRYFPESKNMGTKTVFNKDKNTYEEIVAQIYKVKFKVEEVRDGAIQPEPTESDYMVLENVVSLFRGTHVVVNVDMYESIVEIYCQIEEWNWNKNPTLGYVQEDDEDD